jgi:4-amino-4-deoxy-L-arabinose transferase-like glycosyltransferase
LWIATGILLLAAALRLVFLQDVPPGLSQDEVLNADIVNFIRNGKHELFFREGFGHEPLYHYWSVPFQILLGDNILSIRLPAVFLGLLLIAITMRWAFREFGRLVALIAGLGLAISWWPIIFSRIGIRPVMEPLLLMFTIWFWPRRPWLAGIMLGLSIYSYTAARFVFLVPLIFGLYLLIFHRGFGLRWHYKDRYSSLRSAIVVFAVALVLYFPLALTLRSDPTLEQRVAQLSGPLDELQNGDFESLVNSTRATLGVFTFTGDPRWTYSLPGRPLFDPLNGLLFYVGLGLILWNWKKPVYALIMLWILFGLIPSAVTPDAPSTIRLIGALPFVYVVVGLAVELLVDSWRSKNVRQSFPSKQRLAVLWLLILIVIGINFGRTLDDGFLRWPKELEARQKYQTILLDIARHWKEDPAASMVLSESFFEPIDADSFRRTLGNEPSARWIQNGSNVQGALIFPAGTERGRLYVPEFAPLPSALLDAAQISSQPIYQSTSNPAFTVYELPNLPSSPDTPYDISLEGKVTFLGYSVLEELPDQLSLLTFWRVEESLPDDLAIFMHLSVGESDIIAQHDGLDAAPQTLQPGDQFIQKHDLVFPAALSDNRPLILQVGMYEREEGRRLLHSGDPADRIILMDDLRYPFTCLSC